MNWIFEVDKYSLDVEQKAQHTLGMLALDTKTFPSINNTAKDLQCLEC